MFDGVSNVPFFGTRMTSPGLQNFHLSTHIQVALPNATGDAIFFGPGFIHQTSARFGPAASVTWQFDRPWPSTFLRQFMVRIRFTPDVMASWEQIHDLVRRAEARTVAQIRSPDLLDFLDVNGDENVTEEEREEVLKRWSLVLQEVKSSVPQKLQRLNLGLAEVVHDEADLKRMPKKIRSAIRQWELEAFRLDAQSVSIHADLWHRIGKCEWPTSSDKIFGCWRCRWHILKFFLCSLRRELRSCGILHRTPNLEQASSRHGPYRTDTQQQASAKNGIDGKAKGGLQGERVKDLKFRARWTKIAVAWRIQKTESMDGHLWGAFDILLGA